MFERASMDFEKTLEDLHACLPEDLRLALLRRHWQFFREEIGGAFAGLECPLDLLPDREAARASMRRFDQAFAEWQLTRSPAQDRFTEICAAQMLDAWLAENPVAGLLLADYRANHKSGRPLPRPEGVIKQQPPEERRAAVLDALPKLDPDDDQYWTTKGLPRYEVVAYLSGVLTLTREELAEIAPDLTRQTAAYP